MQTKKLITMVVTTAMVVIIGFLMLGFMEPTIVRIGDTLEEIFTDMSDKAGEMADNAVQGVKNEETVVIPDGYALCECFILFDGSGNGNRIGINQNHYNPGEYLYVVFDGVGYSVEMCYNNGKGYGGNAALDPYNPGVDTGEPFYWYEYDCQGNLFYDDEYSRETAFETKFYCNICN